MTVRYRILINLAILSVILMFLTGCGATAKFLRFEAPEEHKPFHPPLPPPLYPVTGTPKVLTPAVTAAMNARILGECTARTPPENPNQPYVYIGFDDQTWLTLGQYDAERRAHMRHLYKVIEWYGHPDLQPEEAAEGEE